MNQRGFTLLEVLVATVIMAVAVAGLLGSLSTSMRSGSRLTDHDRAALLARTKMDELLVQSRLPRLTMIEGALEAPEGMKSGWRARVTPFEMPPNAGPGTPILERVELEVWWTAGEQRRTFTLEGYRRGVLTREDIAAGGVVQ